MRTNVRQSLQRLDRQILLTVLFRGWTVCAGAGTLILVPMFLSKEEQGYYFTFVSLLALQIFFELGLNQVIIQLVASRASRLAQSSWMSMNGPSDATDAVRQLATLTRNWYLVAAVAFFLIAGLGGGAIFLNSAGAKFIYVATWVLLALFTAVNLSLSSRLAILDGLGLVSNVALIRLRQSLAGYLCAWAALIAGGGLMAMVCIPAASALFSTWALRDFSGAYLHPTGTRATPADVVWKRDILPMQWRMAVSWISGYFMFQVFTPAIFKTQGAVEAGRVGIALSAFTAIQSVGMSWIGAKVPSFSRLIALGERRQLDDLFDHLMKQALVFTATAAVLLIAAVNVLDQLGLRVFERIASNAALFTLFAVTMANLVVYCKATYMRSHNHEPMMAVSVCSAIATGLSTAALASYGIEPVLFGYLAVSVALTWPWTNAIFRRHRLARRTPASGSSS